MAKEVINFLGIGVLEKVLAVMHSTSACKIKYKRFSFYFKRRNEGIKSESATVICYHEVS